MVEPNPAGLAPGDPVYLACTFEGAVECMTGDEGKDHGMPLRDGVVGSHREAV